MANSSMKRFLKSREKLIFDSSNFFIINTSTIEEDKMDEFKKIVGFKEGDTLKDYYIFPKKGNTYVKDTKS